MRPAVTTAHAADELLRFVWAQSYDKSFGDAVTHWATDPDRAPGVDRSAPGVPLETGLHAAVDAVPYPVDWSRDRRTAATPTEIQALLYNTFGILRREPRNAYNDHRAFPSPRSLFPTHAYYRCQDDAGSRAFHYDAIGHVLQPVRGRGPLAGDGVIALATHYTHIPDYYRSLRYTLGLLEAGHALYTLELVAHALGIASRVRHAFDDAAWLAELRLRSEDGWAVPVVVELGPSGPSELTDASVSSSDAADPGSVDRSCWLPGSRERRSWTGIDPVSPPVFPPDQALTIPDTAPADARKSTGQVLFDRNAGRGVAGVSAVQRPISRAVVATALQEGFRRLESDLTHRDRHVSNLRVLLVAERVSDLDDGLYEVFPGTPWLASIRRGRLLKDVEHAFPSALHLASYNLAWFFVVDYPRIVGERGPRGFRVANIELGWVGQALGCALAAHGLFARPCRSYHEPVLDSLFGLSPSEAVGYAIVCGVNRFQDIRLDLRC